MRVLVTGAFGYLGGRLCDALAQQAFSVLASGRSVPDDARPFARRHEVRAGDLLEEGACARLVAGAEAVVHLAAMDENEAARDPEGAMRVSAEATRRLLDAARSAGTKRFVFFSTFHVYGPGARQPIDEATPTRPAHPYAISHLAGEGYCRAEHLRGGLVATSLRLSNAYGAPVRLDVDRWTLAHNDFCRQAIRDGRVVMRSPGLQHRDIVWVEDVATAVAAVLRADPAGLGGQAGEAFNLGGERSMAMRDLAELVARQAGRVLGREVPVEAPAPAASAPAEIPVRFSTARLQALGWRPRDGLVEETDRLLRMVQAGVEGPR